MLKIVQPLFAILLFVYETGSSISTKTSFIAKVYISTLFDFINEAKSGLKNLRNAEVMQDYFYCQILFFIFFAKFQKENPLKRLFGVKLALKLHEYASSGEASLQSVINSLEKFYFNFTSSINKNKKPTQIGPVLGARSPFMGLSYFEEKDREYFFGREKFKDELLNAIEEKSVIALAGASGSGKSSIVHAGIIPELRKQNYLIYKFRPTENPFESVIHALGDSRDVKDAIANILKKNPGKRLFLLGDQFEEMFTLCTDFWQKENLASALIDCAKEFKNRFKLFINIRSDFWTKLIEDGNFASVVGDSGSDKNIGAHFFLNPMNIDELRSAIEKPLALAKLQIQEGLTDLILTSIAREPGSLPLLEFCLEELWKRQVDYTITYNAYKEIGEVKGALATYAEIVYSSLNEQEKKALKKIMLQLVQPGQGTDDTRRIALSEEVEVNQDFINKLANNRMIVTGTNEADKQTIEIIHEALIREWDRLKVWINSDREFRIWQEKLRNYIKEWELNNKENQNLLKDLNLAEAEKWLELKGDNVSIKEEMFITLSQNYKKQEELKFKEVNTLSSQIKIISVCIVGIVIAVMFVTGYSYRTNTTAILSLTEDLIAQINSRVIQKTRNYLMTAVDVTELSSRITGKGVQSLSRNPNLDSLMTEVLRLHPQLSMFNIGNQNGDFLQQKRMTDGTIATKIISRNRRGYAEQTLKERNLDGEVIKITKTKNEQYDPRKRPWYIGAMEAKKLHWSDVYIFSTGNIPGVTASSPVRSGDQIQGVFGLDIPLDEISTFLQDLKKELADLDVKSSLVFIFNSKGEVVAYPDPSIPMIQEEGKAPRPRKVDELEDKNVIDSYKVFVTRNPSHSGLTSEDKIKSDKFSFESDGVSYIASYVDFPEDFDKDWIVGLIVKEDEMIGPINETNNFMIAVSVFILVTAIILIIFLLRLQKGILSRLIDKKK